MNRDLLFLLDRPIAFHRCFVTLAGSVTAGLMLSQALYWSRRTTDESGWFYKTQAEWEEETGLVRREQETARKALLDLVSPSGERVWEEQRRGVPARLYYRVNLDAISDLLSLQNVGKCQSRMSESDNLECRKVPILHGGKCQSLYTETTTENTTENTTGENDAVAAKREASQSQQKLSSPSASQKTAKANSSSRANGKAKSAVVQPKPSPPVALPPSSIGGGDYFGIPDFRNEFNTRRNVAQRTVNQLAEAGVTIPQVEELANELMRQTGQGGLIGVSTDTAERTFDKAVDLVKTLIISTTGKRSSEKIKSVSGLIEVSMDVKQRKENAWCKNPSMDQLVRWIVTSIDLDSSQTVSQGGLFERFDEVEQENYQKFIEFVKNASKD